MTGPACWRRQPLLLLAALALGAASALASAGPAAAAAPGAGTPPAAEAAGAHAAPTQAARLPPVPPEYLQQDAGTVHFAYHPSARDCVRLLADLAGPVRTELGTALGAPVLGSVEVRVAASAQDMERVVPPGAPRATPALTFSGLGLLVLSLDPLGTAQVEALCRYGMAQLALDEATARHPVPLWFREGFALELSGVTSSARGRALWSAALRRNLVPLGDLDRELCERTALEPLAAAEAADFVRYLCAGPRRATFGRAVAAVREGASLPEAIESAYQTGTGSLELAWREDLGRHRLFLPILLGGTALWLAVALGAGLRLRARQRLARRSAKQEPVHAGTAEEGAAGDVPRLPAQGAAAAAPLADLGVPKVAHEGRWHTVH
ncbi:MAG: hypothetical protein HY744_15055 [Deltaproteobacteria bacterium]|nr:hypothetical protein [Deltaproteobacteria bacterium]